MASGKNGSVPVAVAALLVLSAGGALLARRRILAGER